MVEYRRFHGCWRCKISGTGCSLTPSSGRHKLKTRPGWAWYISLVFHIQALVDLATSHGPRYLPPNYAGVRWPAFPVQEILERSPPSETILREEWNKDPDSKRTTTYTYFLPVKNLPQIEQYKAKTPMWPRLPVDAEEKVTAILKMAQEGTLERPWAVPYVAPPTQKKASGDRTTTRIPSERGRTRAKSVAQAKTSQASTSRRGKSQSRARAQSVASEGTSVARKMTAKRSGGPPGPRSEERIQGPAARTRSHSKAPHAQRPRVMAYVAIPTRKDGVRDVPSSTDDDEGKISKQHFVEVTSSDYLVPISFVEWKNDNEDSEGYLQGAALSASTRSLRSSTHRIASHILDSHAPTSPDMMPDTHDDGPLQQVDTPPPPQPSSPNHLHQLGSLHTPSTTLGINIQGSDLVAAIRKLFDEEHTKLRGALQSQIDLSIGQALQHANLGTLATGSSSSGTQSVDAISTEASRILTQHLNHAQEEFSKKAEHFQEQFIQAFEQRMSSVLQKIETETNRVVEDKLERFQDRITTWMQEMALPSSSDVHPSPGDQLGDQGK